MPLPVHFSWKKKEREEEGTGFALLPAPPEAAAGAETTASDTGRTSHTLPGRAAGGVAGCC